MKLNSNVLIHTRVCVCVYVHAKNSMFLCLLGNLNLSVIVQYVCVCGGSWSSIERLSWCRRRCYFHIMYLCVYMQMKIARKLLCIEFSSVEQFLLFSIFYKKTRTNGTHNNISKNNCSKWDEYSFIYIYFSGTKVFYVYFCLH